MYDFKFWRESGDQFKRLDPEARLRLKWRYFPKAKRYHCEVVGDNDSRLILAECKVIVASVGRWTDPSDRSGPSDPSDPSDPPDPPDPPDPITGWLLQVIHVSQNDEPRNGTVQEEGGGVESYNSGVVNRFCEVSAFLCYGIAAQVASIDVQVVGDEGRITWPKWALKSDAEQNAGLTPLVENSDIANTRAIEMALESGDRKQAVQLRIGLEGCDVKTLWSEAFSERRGKAATLKTAFYRWRACQRDTPSWADGLMRARLLKSRTG